MKEKKRLKDLSSSETSAFIGLIRVIIYTVAAMNRLRFKVQNDLIKTRGVMDER